MLTIIFLAFGLLNTFAPAEPVQLEPVVKALSAGDAGAVGSYFDTSVELVLPGTDDILSSSEAKQKLSTFFQEHPPKNFTRVHGGTSSGSNGAYLIGTLTCNTESYRLYIFSKTSEAPLIQELRIEEQ